MFAKLESIEQTFEELEKQLGDPDLYNDQERFRKLSKAHSDLKDIVALFREYKHLRENLRENETMLHDQDQEIRQLAEEEADNLRQRLPALEHQLKLLLLPTDPLDEKNTILEIRAGTGGEEAALFAADLYRMYARYAERNSWSTEILSSHETDNGGFKEIIVMITGHKIYSRLKFEAGTHRVQRVPETEAQGRIHTSAVTVAVLPEAEEIDVELKPEDLRVDICRSSGPGGQSVNTTDSAVRITHIPTGMVVQCQDEKSQIKNKAKALKVLRSRILKMEEDKRHEEEARNRRSQVGSGDRSGRIRTYNFPQSRVTDHRVNLTLYHLDTVMDGGLNEIIEVLIASNQAEALQQQAKEI